MSANTHANNALVYRVDVCICVCPTHGVQLGSDDWLSWIGVLHGHVAIGNVQTSWHQRHSWELWPTFLNAYRFESDACKRSFLLWYFLFNYMFGNSIRTFARRRGFCGLILRAWRGFGGPILGVWGRPQGVHVNGFAGQKPQGYTIPNNECRYIIFHSIKDHASSRWACLGDWR